MKRAIDVSAFILSSLIVLFTSCSDNLNSLHNALEEQGVLQHIKLSVSEVTTRTGLTRSKAYQPSDYLFSQGDSISVYNLSTGKQYILTYSEDEGCFVGNMAWSEGDEISAVYPRVAMNANDNIVNIASEDISSSPIGCCWGIARPSSKNNIISASIILYTLSSKCKFTFLDNDEYVLPVKKVLLQTSKGALYQSRNLNIKTGQLEGGETTSSLIVENDDSEKWDSATEFCLFPTSAEIECHVTEKKGNTYIGNTSQFRLTEDNDEYEVIKCQKEADARQYVEVCGVKWAMGNLQYDAYIHGDKGFREHYRIANNQWDYFGAVNMSRQDTTAYDSMRIDRFNWGVVGDYVFDIKKRGRIKSGEIDIAGKLYSDSYFMANESDDADNALFGDLCYWASNGKYRLPTKDELYKLYSEANVKWGYILTDEGIYIRGALFTTPEGNRTVDTKNKNNIFTREELRTGLFLPAAGFRQAGDDVIKRAGNGFYWNSYYNYDDKGIYSLRYINLELYWTLDGPHYGRSMRPVINEKPEPQQKNYIEVCGIKWAKGNLIYREGYSSTGFVDNWGLSPSQWYYANADDGQVSSTEIKTGETSLFNWGVCGSNALNNRLYAMYYGDISAKLFKDRNCTVGATFDSANYGDIAYWASRGQYRMPSHDELYKLFTEASRESGWYTLSNGKTINGYLFYDPNGNKTVSTTKREFTDQDLEKGVFLPCCGTRNSQSTTIKYSGQRGYYYDSFRDEEMSQCLLRAGEIIYRSTYPGAGRAIRPVLND